VCDYNSFERTMNIISSIPYTMIGLHTLRRVVSAVLCAELARVLRRAQL